MTDESHLTGQAIAASWSTPRSSPNENRQTKRTPSQEGGKHGLSLGAEVHRRGGATRQTYRTPRATDGTKGNPNQTDGGPSLSNQAVHMPTSRQTWDTVTAQDAKNDGGPSQTHRNTMPLNTLVKQETTGSLNPEWTEWLMAWPRGWTDCEHSVTAKCLRRWLLRSRIWLERLGY
jgi:hypothetical protein